MMLYTVVFLASTGEVVSETNAWFQDDVDAVMQLSRSEHPEEMAVYQEARFVVHFPPTLRLRRA
jgi:hypothetical protein